MAAQPQADPQAAPTADLHEVAAAACKDLQELATGLAQAGASQPTVEAVKQMYDVCHQILTALGKGQSQTADEEGPAEDQAPSEEPETMDQAAAQTHQMMQQSAASRK